MTTTADSSTPVGAPDATTSAPVSAPTTSGGTPPPNPGAPATPKGFVPMTRVQARVLSKADAPQRMNVGLFVTELLSMSASGTYRPTFGPRVPEPVGMANKLSLAAAWNAEADAALQWSRYAQNQAELAWDGALVETQVFQTEFDTAVANDNSLATQMPGAMGFFSSRKAAAKRGASVRTKKNAAKKLTTTGTGDATVVTPAPATPPAGTGTIR